MSNRFRHGFPTRKIDFNLQTWRDKLLGTGSVQRKPRPMLIDNLPRSLSPASHMQKIDIQLPPGDLVDLWDLTRLIATSICPSLRELKEHEWLQKKLEKHPASEFEFQSDMTPQERTDLLRLLPNLPLQAGMSRQDRDLFMSAYLSHAERFAWRPVFLSEEDVTANSFQILEIQEKHLHALQLEIQLGKIRAINKHHLSEKKTGRGVFIDREDALLYLERQYLRTTATRSNQSHRAETTLTPESHTSIEASRSTDQEQLLPRKKAGRRVKAPQELSRPAGKALVSADGATQKPSTKDIAEHKQTSSVDSANEENRGHMRESDALIPMTIMRRKQVEERTSLSRSAIYDRLDPTSPRHDPTFPKQVKLGESSVGWLRHEIDAWLAARTRVSR